MAGLWPSLVFLRFYIWTSTFFMDREEVENSQKKRGPIKDSLYGFRGNVSCGTRRVVPSGQDSSIMEERGNSVSGLFLLLQYCFVSVQF